MEIAAFQVTGFRSLADIDEVPVRAPTILTGPNDGGKTALLGTLDFLLGGSAPQAEDRTWAREEDTPPGGVDEEGRFAEVSVCGVFHLGIEEQEALDLPERVELRRRAGEQLSPVYEVHLQVPEDERLRALDRATLAELKERAAALEIEAEGPANRKASFLEPLHRLAADAPKVEAWAPAPQELLERLPQLLPFASTEAPDPEGEIRESLRTVYQKLVADGRLMAPVREAEQEVGRHLEEEAGALCRHIQERCQELSDIEILPSVSFSGGFREVTLRTARGEDAGVELRRAGSGRRRRITLAVWEWTTDLLSEREPSDPGVVVAYDEPDTHLDYRHQRELVDLLRAQAALPHTRLIVATHSLNLIDKVDIEDVVHVDLEGGRTVIRRLAGSGHGEIDRYLADVAASMGLRNSVLLHERCFLAVEGETEAQAVPILFRGATGHTLQAAGIALISASGNDGALKVARFLNDHGRTVRFLVDSDSTSDRARGKIFRPDSLRAHGMSEDQMFCVGDEELEDLFTDEQWAATADAAWPRADGRAWAPEDFGALRGAGGFSTTLAEMVRKASETAPARKPGYLVTLVQRLKSPEEIPEQLHQVFQELIAVADTY